MELSEVKAKLASVENKFHELGTQRQNLYDEQMRLAGEYRLLQDLQTKLESTKKATKKER